MATDGQDFLQELADSCPHSFEGKFSRIATSLGLGGAADANALSLLCTAAFYASLCNIAFNGLGGCRGAIQSDREPNRMRLERRFMAARDKFYASKGWQALSESDKDSVRRTFLNVFVVADNLAW